MAGGTKADIVFCLDASATMDSLLAGVRDHIGDLIGALHDDRPSAWDVRLDFLAYSTPYDYGGGKKTRRTDLKHNGRQGMLFQSIRKSNFQLLDALYRPAKDVPETAFFTKDVEAFKAALQEVKYIGDETPAVALDMAADFPFRDAASCHRVVILITDEPLERGSAVKISQDALESLSRKIQDKRIALYLITPKSEAFEDLSQIEKCEWMFLDVCALATYDFGKMLQRIGSSISALKLGPSATIGVQPLFHEETWTDGGDCVCTDLTDLTAAVDPAVQN